MNRLAHARLARAALGDIRVPVTRLPPYGGKTIILREGEAPPARAVCAPLVHGRKIRVCLQRTPGPPGAPITDAGSACRLVSGIASADRESFYAIHLDARHRPIGTEEVSRGGVASVEVSPREVFKAAILSNSVSLIFAHNHPSGDASPSAQDIELTKRLQAGGDMLGIKVLDHVVVGGRDCTSMRDRGMLSGGRHR